MDEPFCATATESYQQWKTLKNLKLENDIIWLVLLKSTLVAIWKSYEERRAGDRERFQQVSRLG